VEARETAVVLRLVVVSHGVGPRRAVERLGLALQISRMLSPPSVFATRAAGPENGGTETSGPSAKVRL
jgi:hypothetical protein